MSAAAAAAQQWGSVEAPVRSRALSAVASALETVRPELVALGAAETRLGEAFLHRELSRTTFQLSLYADQVLPRVHIGGLDDMRPGNLRRSLLECRAAAEGPVLVFASNEFPFAFGVAGAHTASAWAAGRPVVVVAHPGHPRLSRRTAEVVDRALADAGVPGGTFALVEGEAQGWKALRHPTLRDVAFTGTQSATRALVRVARDRPTPLSLHGELGSIEPVVITRASADARAEEVVERFATSLARGSGPFCASPGLVFVPAGHSIVYEIAWRVRALPAAQMLNTETAECFLRASNRLAGLTGAQRLLWPGDGTPLAPRLLALDGAALRRSLPQVARECFGPLGLVVLYERAAHIREMVSTLAGHSTSQYAQP